MEIDIESSLKREVVVEGILQDRSLTSMNRMYEGLNGPHVQICYKTVKNCFNRSERAKMIPAKYTSKYQARDCLPLT
jgi:hypothetical protein